MKNNFIILILLSVIPTLLWSNTTLEHKGGIEGVVMSNKSDILPGATIQLQGQPIVQFSNEIGYFSISDLDAGTYEVMVSYIGFETITIKGIQVRDNATTYIEVTMEAQQVNLPEVEVLPGPDYSFQTISQIDLEMRPARDAQEVLSVVPGLFVAQHAGGGKAEQIFLRGFDIDHGTDVNLTVDGMPVNMVSHAHGQGYSDLHFVIPELIDQVQFDKGPYNAETGNFATAGEVAYQTVDALERGFISLGAGQFDTYRLVSGTNILKDRNNKLYAVAEANFSNGYFEAPQAFNRINAMAKYTTRLSSKEQFSASLSTFTSRWDASGQIPQRAVDSGQITRFGAIDDTEGGQTSRTNINLEYLKNTSPNTFLRQQLFYSQYNFELYSNFTFFARDPINGDQIRQRENRSILGYNGSLQQNGKLWDRPFYSEVGLQIRLDEVSDNELSYTANRSETLQRVAYGDVREANAGLYYKGLWMVSEPFSIEAGLRFDQFYFSYQDKLETTYNPAAVTDNTWSPKLKLTYRINPKWQIYLNGGIGFHSNDTRVVVAQNGMQTLPSAYGADLGTIFKPFPKLLVHATAWILESEQEFVYVGDEGIVEPSGRSRRVGVDLSMRYQMTSWLFAFTDLNMTQPRSLEASEGENYIPLAPTLTSTGGVTAQLKNGFSASINYRYLGDRAANEDYSLTAEGYFLMDARLRYQKGNFAIDMTARNLLNTEWKEAQFDTESRLQNETTSVSEIHFTPGQPFGLSGQLTYFF